MIGVIEIISEEEIRKHGYWDNDIKECAIIYHPARNASEDHKKIKDFTKITKFVQIGFEKYKIVGDHLIENVLSIEDGRDKYPELFI